MAQIIAILDDDKLLVLLIFAIFLTIYGAINLLRNIPKKLNDEDIERELSQNQHRDNSVK